MKRNNGYTAPGIFVKKSPIDKLGVFARTEIKKGKVVVVWGGKVRTAEEIKKMKFASDYALPIYPGFFLAETNESELDNADFVNHSCEPNCVIKNMLIMVTKRVIKEGEELTCNFDHGRGVGRRTRCMCGAKNCKEIVYF